MVGAAPPYPHLLPMAQEIAGRPAGERIAALTRQYWISYPRAQTALAKLEGLLSLPPVLRTPYLLIAGPKNNGKSMIAERLRREHPPAVSSDGSYRHIPVVVMQMPAKPSMSRFYAALLSALGLPLIARGPIEILEQSALRSMKMAGTRLLIIDDVHNLLSCKGRQQRELLNLMRFLGNELRIPLACLGARDAYHAIRSDEQLENRFEPFALPRWTDDNDFGQLLASFEAIMPLREPSGLSAPAMRALILRRSDGTIGELVALLIAAARLALEQRRERIGEDIILDADYRAPSGRC